MYRYLKIGKRQEWYSYPNLKKLHLATQRHFVRFATAKQWSAILKNKISDARQHVHMNEKKLLYVKQSLYATVYSSPDITYSFAVLREPSVMSKPIQ